VQISSQITAYTGQPLFSLSSHTEQTWMFDFALLLIFAALEIITYIVLQHYCLMVMMHLIEILALVMRNVHLLIVL